MNRLCYGESDGWIAQEKLKKGIYSKVVFCDFTLWKTDCNLASSSLSEVVGSLERLA